VAPHGTYTFQNWRSPMVEVGDSFVKATLHDTYTFWNRRLLMVIYLGNRSAPAYRRAVSANGNAQCLKWRIPANTMAIPCSLAASMLSLSRIDPPGCMIAVTPACAAASIPSLNGKNASDAMIAP
jgi:hypothetical protein